MSKNLKQIKVYFSEEDYQKIKDESALDNISMAEYIRQKINLKIDNPPTPKKAKVTYKKTNPDLLFLLSNISNNINQIAKRLNSKNEFDRKALLDIYKKVMSFK